MYYNISFTLEAHTPFRFKISNVYIHILIISIHSFLIIKKFLYLSNFKNSSLIIRYLIIILIINSTLIYNNISFWIFVCFLYFFRKLLTIIIESLRLIFSNKMDATCKVQDNIHLFRLIHNMCLGFCVHIIL